LRSPGDASAGYRGNGGSPNGRPGRFLTLALVGDSGSGFVVDALDEVWASIVAACQGLSGPDWDLGTDCPGWTVRDQVSHVIGIERMLLGDQAPELAPPLPGHVLNPVGEVNEAWVAARRQRPGQEVLEEFSEVTARRLAELRAMPPERFAVIGWSPIGEVPYGEFMKMRVLDSWVHEQDIRHALGRSDGRGGAGETITIERVSEVMGYVVGRKVGPPDGTTVEFDVDGQVRRTVTVTMVDGRGQVGVERGASAAANRSAKSPTARVSLDSEWFWMLGCGRRTGEDARRSGAVVLSGDEALGERVLDAMNFMV
jgi:uncharacterized protein (TIGR03083 family)